MDLKDEQILQLCDLANIYIFLDQYDIARMSFQGIIEIIGMYEEFKREQQSDDIHCEHPDEAIIRDKPTDYCMACHRNI